VHSEAALILASLVLGYAVVSGLIQRWCVAPALLFVIAGIVLGQPGLDVLHLGAGNQAFTILAQLALTVILFNQASELDLRTVARRGHLVVRLLAVGIPITVALGTLTAVLFLPVLPWWEAVCLAVIVAPTEVALIDALVRDRRTPEQVRYAMSVESGLYDGFALAALLGAVALASDEHHPARTRWAWFALRTELVSVAAGVVIGLVGALVISRSSRRGWMNDTWGQLATLALALISFEAGERLHASGFVAAFVAGLMFAMVARSTAGDRTARTQVSDATAQVLELLVFAILGGYSVIPAWREGGWRVVLFAVAALVVVRVAAVVVALARSGLSARTTLFVGWFGPRGIGTLVLGLLVIDRGELAQGDVVKQAVVVTVSLSLILHSLTAAAGIRWRANGETPPSDGA
jgi:NhaP-type Na+/H+ or K+/H+ antiporter